MKIINKLTLRHMKLNKRRTIVTMIGIIIAVAMIMAVSTVAYSIMDYAARDAMEDGGYFHLKFSNYYYKDNEVIVDELNVENFALMKVLGDYVYEASSSEEDGGESEVVLSPYTWLKTDEDDDVEYADATRLVAVEDKYYDMLSIELAAGDYPKDDTEVLLSANMSRVYSDKGVGDTITIGGKEYTICGTILGIEFESRELFLPNAMTYPIYTRLDTSTLQQNDIVSGYFYAGGVLDNLEEQAEELVSKLQESGVPEGELVGEEETWYCDGVSYLGNYRVLIYLGLSQYSNINGAMDSLKLILIIIIMVGSVSLIANGFIISISERGRYLGMLASVGATKKQKRSSVYFEGFLEGIIAIPLGILAGLGGIGITFELIEPLVMDISGTDTELKLVVNSSVIIWTIIFSVLTIFFSAYFPAKRASRISPIDAIRQNKEIKVTSRAIKTMGITRRVFGFEGELALKNLKRNKKKYKVTVFSMFISLTLFISVYSLIHYVKEGVYLEMGEIGYDIHISMNHWVNDNQFQEGEASEDTMTNTDVEAEFVEVTDKVLSDGDKYIDASSRYAYMFYTRNIDSVKQNIDEEFYNKEYLEFEEQDGSVSVNPAINIVTMNDTDLHKYLDKIGVDYEVFVSNEDNVIFFDGYKAVWYTDDERHVYQGDVYNDKLTDIKYTYNLYEEQKKEDLDGSTYVEGVKIDAIDMNYHIFAREEKLMGLESNSLCMLVTPKRAEKLTQYGAALDYYMVLDVNNSNKVEEIYEEAIDSLATYKNEYYLVNYTEEVEQMENTVLLISVFVYGFIILITLICVANIVNTISTSLALRRREFAMLKSVGMTDRAFNKMIAYESAFYGIKALIFGLPVGTVIMLLIKGVMQDSFTVDFGIPWLGYFIAIVGVFVVIGLTMLYSSRKIKKANIIEALREENA